MNIFKFLLKLPVILPAFILGLTQFLYPLSHDHIQGELHFCLLPPAVITAKIVETFFHSKDMGNL